MSTTMHDTTGLRGYTPSGQPQLGADKRYLLSELRKIQDAISALVQAAKALEERLVAGGL